MSEMPRPEALTMRVPAVVEGIGGLDGKPEWAMNRREIERVLRARAGLPPVRRNWAAIAAVVALAVTGAGGALFMQRSEAALPSPTAASDAAEPTPLQLAPLEYATLAPTSLERTIKVTGTLRPARRAQLSSEIGGRIERVAVEPGTSVAAGDLLVQFDVEPLTIERDLARSNAEATRAQLALAETRLRRTEALNDRGASTASALDEARAQVDQLRATLSALEEQVKAADLRIGDAAVVAPFDGVVSARDVDPGQYVGMGASLLTVVDVGTLEFEAHAPLSGSLPRPGDPVSVDVHGLKARRFAGEVDRVNPVAAEGSRTVPVYIRVDNADSALVAGMFATGRVTLERILDAIVVPADAVREDPAGRFVLRIAGGRLERADVVAEDAWPGGVLRVVDGLEAGNTVVTASLPALSPGDAVELVEM